MHMHAGARTLVACSNTSTRPRRPDATLAGAMAEKAASDARRPIAEPTCIVVPIGPKSAEVVAVQVNQLIDFRGSLFLCGQHCFAPWVGMETPVSAPRSGAARQNFACAAGREMGPFGSSLNSVSGRLCETYLFTPLALLTLKCMS